MSNEVSCVPVRFILDGIGEVSAEFIRFFAPRTVDTILKALPLEGRVALWQEQVYFEIPVKIGKEKAVSMVETGSIAYWPMGAALCIFFGKSQPYSQVNRVGRILDNLELFPRVAVGIKVRVEKISTANLS